MLALTARAYRWMHLITSRAKHRTLRSHLSGINQGRPLRVLDLGCGPGQDATLFDDRRRFSYLGVDQDPHCVSIAQRLHKLDFKVADATSLNVGNDRYDIVLMNSLLHHLDDIEVCRLLKIARGALAEDGECLILDMVWPPQKSVSNIIARALIKLDRGRYCRSESDLEAHFEPYFTTHSKDRFAIRCASWLLWDMRFYVCKPQS
jgi:ubiquinone/menaquinone biosynthesis C-methylase UbiE